MADVQSTGSGYNTFLEDEIAHNLVDNSQYTYYVNLHLPASTEPDPPGSGDIVSTRVYIQWEQTYPVYLPVIGKP
jgi:hypothetical protein